MDVIIDTNILNRDYFLNGESIRQLTNFLRPRVSRLIIPQVVIEELVGHFDQHLTNVISSFDSINAKLKQAGLPEVAQGFEKEVVLNEYRQRLIGPIRSVQTVIIDSIAEDFILSIRASYGKEKPTKGTDDGLRDASIWQSIVRFERDTTNDIIFISNNSNDFANPERTDLHETLRSDLSNPEKFAYYTGIIPFLKDKLGYDIDPEVLKKLDTQALQDELDKLSEEGNQIRRELLLIQNKDMELHWKNRMPRNEIMMLRQQGSTDTEKLEALQQEILRNTLLREQLTNAEDVRAMRERLSVVEFLIGEIAHRLRSQ